MSKSIVLLFFLYILTPAVYGHPLDRAASFDCQSNGYGSGAPALYYIDTDGDWYLETIPARLCSEDPRLTTRRVLESLAQSMIPEEFDCAPDNPKLFQILPVLGPDSDSDGVPSKLMPGNICAGIASYIPTEGYYWDIQKMAIDWVALSQFYYRMSKNAGIEYYKKQVTGGAFLVDGQMAYNWGQGWDIPGLVDCNDNDAAVPYGPVRLDSDGDGVPDAVDTATVKQQPDGTWISVPPLHNEVLSCYDPYVAGKKTQSVMHVSLNNNGFIEIYDTPPVQVWDCQPNNPLSIDPMKVYRDSDKDGKGSDFIGPIEKCVKPSTELKDSVPVGYVVNGGDCNDDIPSVQVCELKFNQAKFDLDMAANPAKAIIVEAKTNVPAWPWTNLIDVKPYLKDNGNIRVEFQAICNDCADLYFSSTTKISSVIQWHPKATTGGFHNVSIVAKAPYANLETKLNIKVFVVASTTIGYLNGVNNSDDKASKSLDAAEIKTQAIVANVFGPQSKPVLFDKILLYNPSAGLSLDLFELFFQKVQELSEEIVEEGDKEYSRRILFDGIESSNLEALQRALTIDSIKVKQFAAKIFIAVLDLKRQEISGSSRIGQGQGAFKESIEKKIEAGSRMILVSHSQGNQFSNEVYEGLSPLAQLLTRQVQVAPTTNRSLDHFDSFLLNHRDVVRNLTSRLPNTNVRDRCDSLLDEDMINRLNELFNATNMVIVGGPGGLPMITNTDEFIEASTLYHGFSECYLDEQSESLRDFQTIFESSLRSIQL